METHISWVILAGDVAYKIKKPVDFGFLDFSTLDKRRLYCAEELRLNRRLAPSLYLDVVSFHGDPAYPREGHDGPLLEFAVKLRRFDDNALASQLAADGRLNAALIDGLANTLAAFHANIPHASWSTTFGSPETILRAAAHNFTPLQDVFDDGADTARLNQLEVWTHSHFERLRPTLLARKNAGHIRECHGDLHLGNLVAEGDRLIPFDCIEFSEELRWIDTLSELAFVVMDLEVRRLGALAWRLLNRYLSLTGDYEGITVLDFYRVYRAMVRAKIAALSLRQQSDPSERPRLLHQCRDYVEYASRITRPRVPFLLITRGFSGSGKSRLAQALSEALPAIHLRSDVERKRLCGLDAMARTNAKTGEGIYSPDMTRKTYARLREFAESILRAGHPVIVDATFLRAQQRVSFKTLADRLRCGFAILDLTAPMHVLQARITSRVADGGDPSEADPSVLAQQIATAEPLAVTEAVDVIAVKTSEEPDLPGLLATIRQRLDGRRPTSRS
jgi:aminoglycoside phosphotransferase family enzyme/predicted kinase